MILPWLIGLGLFILATILTETESWTMATLTLVGTVFAMHHFHVLDVYGYVQANLFETGMYLLCYIGTGVVWSFVKWFSFLYRHRDKVREAKETFAEAYKVSGHGTVQDYLLHRGLHKRPNAADNKSRIVAWMTFWPFSLVGTFLNDPVRRLFNALFNRFKHLYQQAADHVFRDET